LTPALLFGACSSAHSNGAAATPTTGAPTTTTVASSKDVVPVDGKGAKAVALPASLVFPVIVHAQYSGPGSFIVKGRSSDADTTLVTSRGAYDGTFPVGFVDTRGAPTSSLEIQAVGTWHLDIASATLAPHLNAGVRGSGDAVLYYNGPKARLRVTHDESTPLLIRTFGNSLQRFARGSERVDTTIDLPAGPLFIAVSALGGWSLAPVKAKS